MDLNPEFIVQIKLFFVIVHFANQIMKEVVR